MSFPAGSGGCGGEGHGYNRTISKRGLRQRNGGSRGHTLATARLAPEGAMRPPYLRCRMPALRQNEITLQVAGCSKKRWIFASLTKTRHPGAKTKQGPSVTGVCGRFRGRRKGQALLHGFVVRGATGHAEFERFLKSSSPAGGGGEGRPCDCGPDTGDATRKLDACASAAPLRSVAKRCAQALMLIAPFSLPSFPYLSYTPEIPL
jgi:hypothetical protein